MMTLSVSCGLQGNKKGKTQDTVAAPDNAGGNVDRFPYPDIPLMLSSPDERKAYLLRHYWDEFDFADTTLVNNRELIGKAFVNCISMLADETISTELVRDGIDNFCSAMEKMNTRAWCVCGWWTICSMTSICHSIMKGCMRCILNVCWRATGWTMQERVR